MKKFLLWLGIIVEKQEKTVVKSRVCYRNDSIYDDIESEFF